MQIRKKLAYYFVSIVGVILFSSSVAIYFFSSQYREEGYYRRLIDKARNSAKLLIEVDQIDAELLKRIEKNDPGSLPNEKILIYNNLNEEIYSTDEDNVFQIDKQLLDRIRLEKKVLFRQGEYELMGFLFAGNLGQFVVIAGAIDIYGLKKLANLRTILLIVFGISIILVFISGWIYSGKALQPISKVIDQVNDITITSLNLRVDECNGKDEIAKLANTFNNMLGRLESAFKMQKNFIANASHGLRTPLTAITGHLEVMLMNDRTNNEYRQAMLSVLEDMKNLNITSNQLLLLAQASSEIPETNFEPLRVDDILWQVRSQLIKQNPDYKINISFDGSVDDEQKLTITGNQQLIKTAITNLIDNGCKYSSNHLVDIIITTSESNIILKIFDYGIGIEPADLKNIFEPFYRGKNALVFKGHGIGLSLAKRIVQLHGGEINVESEPGKGSVFTASLQLS